MSEILNYFLYPLQTQHHNVHDDDAVSVCNVLINFPGRDARNTIFLAATSPVAAIFLTITACKFQQVPKSHAVQC